MLRHALLFAVLIVFSGCHSEEYTRAYDHAKEEGKSDFYAKAYAEQAEAGRGMVYAKAYAFALETSQKGVGFTQYDDKMKKVWARVYAEKIDEGQNFLYATVYAKHYCKMLPIAIAIAMEEGHNEKFVHQYAKYYIEMESAAKSLFPHQDSKYIKDFSQGYARAMALGATMEQAVEKAFKYANSNLIK